MSNVINFRLARKAKDRAEKARVADANRAKFGRTKTQKLAEMKEEQRMSFVLDGARLDRDSDPDKGEG